MANARDRASDDHAGLPSGNHATPRDLSPGVPDRETSEAPTQRLARGSSSVVSGPRIEWDSPREPTPEELANTEPFSLLEDDPPVAPRSRLPLYVLAVAALAVTIAITLAAL